MTEYAELSSEDVKCIETIMNAMPSNIEYLYFPVISSKNVLNAFKASCTDKGICIVSEYISIIERSVWEMEEKSKVQIPQVCFCGYNCTDKGGCRYWEPYKKDNNGRTYCNHYGKYYYPSERQGCLSFKEWYENFSRQQLFITVACFLLPKTQRWKSALLPKKDTSLGRDERKNSRHQKMSKAFLLPCSLLYAYWSLNVRSMI